MTLRAPLADTDLMLAATQTAGRSSQKTATENKEVGAVRINHYGRLDRDARIRCGLRLPNGRLIPASVVAATFEKGDAGDTVVLNPSFGHTCVNDK